MHKLKAAKIMRALSNESCSDTTSKFTRRSQGALSRGPKGPKLFATLEPKTLTSFRKVEGGSCYLGMLEMEAQVPDEFSEPSVCVKSLIDGHDFSGNVKLGRGSHGRFQRKPFNLEEFLSRSNSDESIDFEEEKSQNQQIRDLSGKMGETKNSPKNQNERKISVKSQIGPKKNRKVHKGFKSKVVREDSKHGGVRCRLNFPDKLTCGIAGGAQSGASFRKFNPLRSSNQAQ